eukprot:510191-Rhodomonas_salina.5
MKPGSSTTLVMGESTVSETRLVPASSIMFRGYISTGHGVARVYQVAIGAESLRLQHIISTG